ncbi:MAG: phosphoribosylformylglycinamidine synthase subunit PurS [Ignavibacteria bacterium]|jgi:phosphoribosylformylglycinamidine synthase
MFTAKIKVTLRKTILDPQGKTIEHSLHSMGYDKISYTRIGKYIEMKIDVNSIEEATVIVNESCKRLLSNPVMEDYEFEIIQNGAA